LRTKEDFVVAKQDFRETIRLSMVETLSELVMGMAQTMPQVALSLIDMVVELMDDVPNKDEIIARIRKINGQSGPEDELTPNRKKNWRHRKRPWPRSSSRWSKYKTP
jgi:hypothetical protein